MQSIKTIDRAFYRMLGLKLREVRERRELTLKQVSNATGYSRSLLDQWELGLCKIKPKLYDRLCEVLQVSTSIKVDITVGFTQ